MADDHTYKGADGHKGRTLQMADDHTYKGADGHKQFRESSFNLSVAGFYAPMRNFTR